MNVAGAGVIVPTFWDVSSSDNAHSIAEKQPSDGERAASHLPQLDGAGSALLAPEVVSDSDPTNERSFVLQKLDGLSQNLTQGPPLGPVIPSGVATTI